METIFRTCSRFFLLLVFTILAAFTSYSQAIKDVCPDPAKPCHHKQKKFDTSELPFKMPAKIVDNKEYKSVAFYAVILKEYGMDSDCGDNDYLEIAETDRLSIQKKYPKLKVFGSYMCPNLSGVGYDFEGKWDNSKDAVLIDNFVAIYAGTTRSAADALLVQLKSTFPEAVVKQMTASYESLSF